MGILAFFKKLVGAGTETNGNGKSGAGDLQLSCVECRKTFTFEAGEQKFFKQRGLSSPRRCGSCRGKKRRRR
ncbi:MAG: hypothetical protein A2901_08020 [Elusimicrobia bacterium RIFCSPLOWO2_01_FULL_54_10]|nr:MAG: hypothetical protein A2901_08020 [Elusimicrobia bacterium RIFCSPLOWO2_01_FULL_54_10]